MTPTSASSRIVGVALAVAVARARRRRAAARRRCRRRCRPLRRRPHSDGITLAQTTRVGVVGVEEERVVRRARLRAARHEPTAPRVVLAAVAPLDELERVRRLGLGARRRSRGHVRSPVRTTAGSSRRVRRCKPPPPRACDGWRLQHLRVRRQRAQLLDGRARGLRHRLVHDRGEVDAVVERRRQPELLLEPGEDPPLLDAVAQRARRPRRSTALSDGWPPRHCGSRRAPASRSPGARSRRAPRWRCGRGPW